jgi:hypothetical protein
VVRLESQSGLQRGKGLSGLAVGGEGLGPQQRNTPLAWVGQLGLLQLAQGQVRGRPHIGAGQHQMRAGRVVGQGFLGQGPRARLGPGVGGHQQQFGQPQKDGRRTSGGDDGTLRQLQQGRGLRGIQRGAAAQGDGR